MKFSALGLLAGIVASAAAEDLLFVDQFQYVEYTEATGTLGYSAKVVTEDEWRAMSTTDFAAFKAIIISDPDCGDDPSVLSFLDDTKATWSPAIQGNMILIGTDPTYHSTGGEAGATTLIDNAVKFAASGKTSGGASQTGLYFALSCYYNSVDSATVTVLSEFGDFGVRGDLSCYNEAHIVASSPALGTLDDVALSDWSCSVHEAFAHYPSVGINGFQALAIAKDIIGDGSQTFGDGTVGLPYIISRGATPAGCGDGKWEADLGEECDDGNTVSGDGCSASCKCESGRPKGDGTCLPPLVSSVSSSSSTSARYLNTTVTKTTTATETTTATDKTTEIETVTATEKTTEVVTATTTFCPPPYKTPTCPTGPKIIGVEVIVIVYVYEECHTLRGSTVTTTITKAVSTHHRPIWNTSKSGYPCYVCALPTVTSGCFMTATTTSIVSATGTGTGTAAPPVVKTCSVCAETTLTACPPFTPLPATATVSTCEVPAPTLASHVHVQTSAVATYNPGPVGTGTPPKPTASVIFTAGAAGLVGVHGAAAGLVALVAVLAL